MQVGYFVVNSLLRSDSLFNLENREGRRERDEFIGGRGASMDFTICVSESLKTRPQ